MQKKVFKQKSKQFSIKPTNYSKICTFQFKIYYHNLKQFRTLLYFIINNRYMQILQIRNSDNNLL